MSQSSLFDEAPSVGMHDEGWGAPGYLPDWQGMDIGAIRSSARLDAPLHTVNHYDRPHVLTLRRWLAEMESMEAQGCVFNDEGATSREFARMRRLRAGTCEETGEASGG